MRVFTATGAYTARRLLLSAGAWMSSLIPDLQLPLANSRREAGRPRYQITKHYKSTPLILPVRLSQIGPEAHS